MGPLASGPGGATSAPGQRSRRSDAGEPTRGGASPELARKRVRGTERGAARHVRTVTRPRVEWWWWHRRTWPETSPATRSAAERLRSTVEKMLRRAIAQAEGLGGSSSPPGVRYGDLTEQEELGISCAAAMADGGASAYGQLAREGGNGARTGRKDAELTRQAHGGLLGFGSTEGGLWLR